jgi:hypothetical protein
MNKQEIFNKVSAHLLRQGEGSLLPDGGCAYRGEHGLKCAIGVLIPDELYTPEIEDKDVHGLPSGLLESLGFFGEDELTFLSGLQKIHDRFPPILWGTRLTAFAKVHNLTLETL